MSSPVASETGSTRTVLEHPNRAYTRTSLAAVPRITGRDQLYLGVPVAGSQRAT